MNQQILVIGAGIAGLASAQTLLKKGLNVVVVEASNRFGGRLKPLQVPFKAIVEAGGQIIHHHDNQYFKMAKVAGGILKPEADYIGYIYDPITKTVLNEEQFEQMYPAVVNSMDQVIDDIHLPDESTQQRISQYPKEFQHFFNSVFGAEYAASLDKLSARGVGLYEKDMPSFSTDYEITNIHHHDILNYHYKDVIDIIQYNQQVVKIDIQQNHVVVDIIDTQSQITTQQHYSKVICCVPMTQLKQIVWSPMFSQERSEQLALVGMEKGGKYIIKLNKPFITKSSEVVIPSFTHNSQWWDMSQGDNTMLAGIIVGDDPKYGDKQFVQTIVDTMNEQFKTDVELEWFHYENWGATQFIEGLYSYPLVGAANNYRQIISKPIDDKVYFAGEAFHEVYYQTIHGAMESGINAAEQAACQ